MVRLGDMPLACLLVQPICTVLRVAELLTARLSAANSAKRRKELLSLLQRQLSAVCSTGFEFLNRLAHEVA